VAMQHLADQQSLRHTTLFRGWERMHTDLGRMDVDLFRVLEEEARIQKKRFELTWMGDKELERIHWDDVDLPEMRYRISVSPTNLFAKTPTAKMEQVMVGVEKGLWSQAKAAAYIGAPDLDVPMDYATAQEKYAEYKVNQALEGDMTSATPAPYCDLGYFIDYATKRILLLEADGVDDEDVDRVRKLVEIAVGLQPKPLSAPALPAPGGVPPSPGPVGPVPVPPQ